MKRTLIPKSYSLTIKILCVFGCLLVSQLSAQDPPNRDQLQIDKQTQQIQQFAQTMADFTPTQTFTFELVVGEQINFSLWPGPKVQKIRGVFYVDDERQKQDDVGSGLFMGCDINGVIQKSFVGERLGVFTLIPKSKPANIKLIFKSDTKAIKIYLSYELKEAAPEKKLVPENQNQNVPTQQEQVLLESESKLVEIAQKFERVRSSVQSQQNALRMIAKHVSRHSKRLSKELQYSTIRIVIETSIVILSGLIGMWILKKQLNKNEYELLV